MHIILAYFIYYVINCLMSDVNQNYIPDIFNGYKSIDDSLLDIDNVSKDDWSEFLIHLSKFNNSSIDDAHIFVNKLITEKKINNEPTVLAGLAKCYIAEGKFVSALKLLGYASALLHNKSPDIQGFVLLEMINLLSVIGSRDHAIHLLNVGKAIVKSEYLKRLYNYYHLVNKIRLGNYELIEDLIKSCDYFEKNQQYATLAYHYKNIGNAFGKIKDFDNEKSFYSKGLLICANYNYSHIKSAIDHDVAMSYYRSGNESRALKKLITTALNSSSDFTKTYTLGNVGFIHFKDKDYQSSYNFFKQSLDIATKSGIFHLLPSICYYLGKNKQALSDSSKASKYFEIGYNASMELAKYKFPVKGERLLVIDEYVKSINVSIIQNNDYSFDFGVDKTLEEIRAIFKNTVLNFLFDQTNSVAEVVKTLQISSSSYSKIKNRYKKYQSDDFVYPQVIIDLIQNHDDLNWKKLNTFFEKKMLMHLYKHYKYNKKVLSSKLNVNYSRLVTKLKNLEENASV